MTLIEQSIPRILQDPPWLGFKHDGYSPTALNQYRVVRGVEFPPEFNREHAGILQSVLSFGLIEAVLNTSVSEDMLLKINDSSVRVLCLDRLSELLEPWALKDRTDEEVLKVERERVTASLSAANKVLSYHAETQAFNYDGSEKDNLPATFVILGCIGQALAHASSCLYPEDETYSKDRFGWKFVLSPHQDRLLAQLRTEGWCPSTVNYVSQTLLTSARHLFRGAPIQKPGDHSECALASCALNQVDVLEYKAQHVDGCSCGYMKPALDPVVRLLEDGSLPVMVPSHVKGERLQVRDASATPYVAISHVWADGLGGNTETGLPICQVWKIAAFAAKFVPSGAFWMDALCVPEDPSVRKKALKLMGRAYREAEAVIVLDKTIQTISKNAPLETILAHLLLSPWNRRMWTLQEAALGKSVYFLLSDGFWALSTIDTLFNSLIINVALSGIAKDLYTLTYLRRWDDLTLSDVVKSLKWRTTSRPSDEMPAIVSLLNVDADKVIEASLDQRMQELLLSLKTVPWNMPFLRGPKLPQLGFRWAPATFMSIAIADDPEHVEFGGGTWLDHSSMAQVTSDGLVAEYLLAEFEPRTFVAGERWTLIDSDSRRQYHITDASKIDTPFTTNFLLFSDTTMPSGIDQCLAVSGGEDFIARSDQRAVCCTYVRRLIVNGQRPDAATDNDAVVVTTMAPTIRKVLLS